MKIAIFGTGYVGLVTGTCFAAMGNHVCCVDVDHTKVDNLNKGISPIYEPGLDALIKRNVEKNRLQFTTDPKQAILDAEVIFIAVGTPPDEDGSADLQYVLQVATTVAEHMNEYKVVVNKSTVPVGTEYKVSEKINEVLKKHGKSISFDVVSNPEFLKEGDAISDCMHPDRIIVGANSEKAANVMKLLYAPFDPNKNRLMIMDVRSAEMTKYVANAMLATKISFMNEMSQIAERVGADIEKVRLGIGADRRIGYHFIYAGCGYGGSCFPKDVRALSQTSLENDYQARVLQAVHDVNDDQKEVLFNKFYQYFNGDIKGKTVAVWGLSFKPNTDDIREAPARVLIEKLWQHGVTVKAYDPEAMASFANTYQGNNNYTLTEDAYDALDGSEALFIVTEWQSFRSPDFEAIKKRLSAPLIFDGRNLFDKEQLANLDIEYISIGR
ncbi:UDP-glucose dehydrogenase family protein [Fangia hongkongensis]|uniref:UDP-glucose dehydrogenase family protein n=1 Tax=Fangia hongkongensis TaxID=270495 RepID=UPI00036A2F9C|nr:UDP-glucose/GDP-mannose dehydrogenase family protein [Fangia hongkongensis]MBK2124569.1 UDP-glucose/GDP-mannose dehydrogenase family protein [Fangia hongkongensis]